MANAWLDSLSEDWVSQAGSEPSHSPSHTTRSKSKTSSTTPISRDSSGRLFGSIRHAQDQSPNSSGVLSERSANEINIFGSRRGPSPSKLSNEYKIQDVKELQARGRQSQRSVSASSYSSVVHNTVEKSHSTSPAKCDTPEWRRRLVQGDLAYGEQRDLFTSAKVGLENMFNPPSLTAPEGVSAIRECDEEDAEDEDDVFSPEYSKRGGKGGLSLRFEEEDAGPEAEDDRFLQEHGAGHDMTMPSSPPIRAAHYDLSANIHDDSATHQLPEQPHRLSLDPVPEESAAFEQQPSEDEDADEEEQGSVTRHVQDSLDEAESVPPSDGSQIHHPMDRESRVVSGQSVLRNESFSAILISPEKNKGGDGAVFGPVELPSGELKRRLENLRWNQMVLAEDAEQAPGSRVVSIGGKSLNVDNTEEYDRMGGFINFRRGGRSADGSFRDRMLSPPIGNDTSEMLPEESLQASTPKQFASVRIEINTVGSIRSPQTPRVPNPSPDKRGSIGRQQQAPSGSPLKLFGPYDTFTNQTLMRRISQFEDQMSNGSRQSADRSADLSVDGPSRSELAQSFIANMQKSTSSRQQPESRQSSAQFGAGELDDFRFGGDADLSRLPEDTREHEQESTHAEDQENQPTQPPASTLFSAAPADTRQGELHIQRMRQSRGAMSSRPSTAEKWTVPADPAASAGKIPVLATPRRLAEIGSEGKRPRTSPSKDPTPKRRRTLHKSDVAFGIEVSQMSQTSHAQLDSVHASHNTMQSVIGRKRRDARDGDKFQYADPDILASRDILRPRTPTPSQRSSVIREKNPNASMDETTHRQLYDDGTSTPQDDSFESHNGRGSSAAWSESAVDGPPMAAEGPLSDGDRKPSIRTDDFLDQSQKLMNMIRNRAAGARGGLASLEESEMKTPMETEQSEEDEDSFQESTREPFSRPPSREGRPVPRVARMQNDPVLLAHLKKYEERSDLDDIVTTTTRSNDPAKSAIRAEMETVQAVQESIGVFQSHMRLYENDEISDPPNIRISMNQRRQDQQHHTHDENPSQASHRSASSGRSTISSIPTGSSHGSDTRKTIAPQTVSHLIPDQVGNMILDRDRNIWIKRRNGSGTSIQNGQSVQSAVGVPGIHNILPSEGSEEDPFADIPDLSVDATMELHNLKPAVASPLKPTGPTLFTPGAGSSHEHIQPVCGDDANDEGKYGKSNNSNADDNETVVEHEISIDQGRLVPSSSPSRKRHLAISFSSPIASIIQDFVVEDDIDSHMDGNAADDNASAASVRRGRRTVSVKFRSTSGASNGSNMENGTLNGASIHCRSASRGSSRKLSVKGSEFVPRPVSRIDEREEDDTNHSHPSTTTRNRELSLIGDRGELAQVHADGPVDGFSELIAQRPASVSVVVTTPGPAPRVDDEQIMAQYVGMLSLSPMSEFTIHQERSLALEASYVLGDRHLVTGDNSKAVMAQSLRDLVNRLTEVEPFDPYWEDMEELDVQGKSLTSLHKLDEFCPQLVSLDAAGNALRNLSGVPATVRHLRIVGNQLSELTSWASLANLQYLDISNNDIKTLSGLKSLVHLRGLKADNCGLENLDGLKYHDALQTLRARGNQITSIDFDGTRLQKLVELDLENNQIASATKLDQLTSLATLNLRRNELTQFTPDNYGALPHVRTLNVSDNQLAALDVRALPALRVLFVDRNRLTRIRGFSKTPRLDSVSIREQLLEVTERLDISSLYHAYEVRKLYLSGNLLETFDPPIDFLNLQLLELANCGLSSLPAKLSRSVPNLRKINLNFNALTDLGALSGISRLKKVLAAGNRLVRAYSVMETLATFAHLVEVDLRDNPVTQGFYPSAHASLSASKEVSKDSKVASSGAVLPAPEPFTLPVADATQDKAYCSRLDMATGMRRRVYTQVCGDTCATLRQLDGLAVDRSLGEVRDAVWQALNAKGIVRKQKGNKAAAGGAEQGQQRQRDDSRWGAEDSFA